MLSIPTRALALFALVVLSFPLAACSSTGIAMREAMGIPKREQLVDRVKDARDSQNEAKQQFNSALEEFLAVTNVGQDEGVREMEAAYRRFEREFKRSESAARDVSARIDSVERVGESLFREWRNELSEFASAENRARSEDLLNRTRRDFDQLVQTMQEAESKMAPVLAAFRDQVLLLKAQLNATAIASLRGTASQIQSDVQRLISEMEASINEANEFINQMAPQG